jgi:hypothetical protein
MAPPRNWRPGSFTKNFSWGQPGSGLSHLHKAINVAFDGEALDVERNLARRRLRTAGLVDYIPANFFLLNRVNGRSFIVADELVRTALSHPANRSFDRLAVFALHLSLAGAWLGARPEQRYPAEWAKHFVVSRVFASGQWNGSIMNAGEIESFISSYPDYSGVWAKKASTNLNYIYFKHQAIEIWPGREVVGECDISRAGQDFGRPRVVKALADDRSCLRGIERRACL